MIKKIYIIQVVFLMALSNTYSLIFSMEEDLEKVALKMAYQLDDFYLNYYDPQEDDVINLPAEIQDIEDLIKNIIKKLQEATSLQSNNEQLDYAIFELQELLKILVMASLPNAHTLENIHNQLRNLMAYQLPSQESSQFSPELKAIKNKIVSLIHRADQFSPHAKTEKLNETLAKAHTYLKKLQKMSIE